LKKRTGTKSAGPLSSDASLFGMILIGEEKYKMQLVKNAEEKAWF